MSATCLEKLKGPFTQVEIRALRAEVAQAVKGGQAETEARRSVLQAALDEALAERREIDDLVREALGRPQPVQTKQETPATLEVEEGVTTDDRDNAGQQRAAARQEAGATGASGKRKDRGDRVGDRLPEGARDDRSLAPEPPADGGAAGADGDTGGVRPFDRNEAVRGDAALRGGRDGLAGQPRAGEPGLAAGGPGKRRGGRRGGGRGTGDVADAGGEDRAAAGGKTSGEADQADAAEGQDDVAGGQAETLAARAENFHAEDPERIYGGTPKVRFGKNRRAIETYRALEESGRDPTPEEREALAGYTGWGSFGQELFQGSWERPIYKDGWREENDWLRAHLGEAEWRSASDSILNAHYTDPPTVQVLWALAERLGFAGGRVLEPSAGIGNFFAMMPKSLKDRSRLTAIELDALSAGMLRLLYPRANVQHKGFQDAHTPDGFYDLVIGNWPFAATGPADRRYNKLSPSLHDYFFLKALDQVRPGGLVLGITSRYTLDSVSRAVRLELAKKAELVAAFRLPSGAFESYAGTAVVTDILILKRRETDLADARAEPWVEAPQMALGDYRDMAPINQHYHDHPERVLGTLGWGHGTTYGRAGVIVTRPDDLSERLERLPEQVPEGVYQPAQQTRHIRYVANNTQERTRAVTIGADGGLYQVLGERLADLQDVAHYRVRDARETARREAQLRALVGLRRGYGALIDAERDGAEDTEALRAALRGQYQSFVDAHGPLRNSRGLAILQKLEDPFYPSLAALEVDREGRYEPAAILSRPVLRRAKKIAKPSVREAYVLERNQGVAIRMGAIAEAAGVSEEQAERELVASGAVFRLPGGGVEPADVYLSGNVRRKLREARAAAEQGEDLAPNLKALEAAIPPTVPYFNIEARLGAQWVGQQWYRQFVAEELIGDPDAAQRLDLEWRVNRWVVIPEDRDLATQTAMRWREVVAYKALSDGRMREVDRKTIPLRQLVEAAFNNGTMRFTGKDEDGKEYVREELSAAANERATAVREAFEEWVWRDPERKLALERDYNEVMNAIATPSFDGSFLSFDGMALQRGEDPFNLRKHQVDAIWRAVVQGSGLYAHEVGTGKTFTMAGIAVESRRFGLARKPLILAHNANSAAVAAEIHEMYPGAKVLYVNNLEPKRVKETLHQIRNDDWDAVVMPHSLLDRLALSRESLEGLAAEEIAALERAFEEAMHEDNAGIPKGFDFDNEDDIKRLRSPTAKELARARLAIKQRIEKMAQAASREDAVTFEDLGVDMLMVDEAHLFKKPPLATRMKMRGLNKAASNRSIALKFLTDYIKAQNGGRGVHLFTGTPITNTLSEIFHMQRYVMQGEMKRDGINEWDAWFNTFATGVSDVELTAAGEYEPITRLAGFINVAELRRMMSTHMDVVFADDMPEFAPRQTRSGKTLADTLSDAERDELLNGRSETPVGRPYKKVVMDVAEMSPEQQAILAYLQQLAKEWKEASKRQKREWMRSGDEHSPLLIDGVAARAGMDARMEDPSLPEYQDSKVNRAVRNILRHYRDEPQSTQVVFMDKGYSDSRVSQGVRVEGHNLAKELVAKLQEAGVPADEIAVVAGGVSPEKKAAIADAVNAGKIRVVIGQTETLGTGVNMQRRLRAMHHLDAPWMPGELEQRNGRGWRQGNTWNTVLEYRYVTERIDGKRWQVLAVKDRFIKSFLKADENTRVIEGDAVSDDAEDSLAATLSEAAGDPRLLVRQKLRQDVERLQRKERVHVQGMAEARDKLRRHERDTATLKTLAKIYRADYEAFLDARDNAQAAQRAAYREAVRGYVHGLGLGLSEAQLDSIRDRGWGPNQPDRDLAQRVQRGVKQAEERGNVRPEEPTTVAVDALLGGKRYSSYKAFDEALSDFGSRYDARSTAWADVGHLYGFTLQAGAMRGGRGALYRLVSRHDQNQFFEPYRANAQGLVAELRDLHDREKAATLRLEQSRQDRPNLERVAEAPFARQKDLDRKRQRLEEIELDMARNPVPAPAWLRHGAPLDSAALVDGRPVVVEGHQWGDDGYFVLVVDGERSRRVPYLDVKGPDGGSLYDEVAFKAPPKVGKPQAGTYLVTNPEGKAEEAPRFLTDEAIEGLLAHGYRIEPAGEPVPAASGGGPGDAGAVREDGYTYGYGDTSPVSSREPAPAADPAAGATHLFPAPAVSAQRAQARDTFNVLYRQVPVGEIRTSPGRIENASAAAHVLAPIRKYGQETFVSLVLDASNNPIAVIRHSKGQRASTPVSPGEVASAIAATEGAASVWFGHNHPSGIPKPSADDVNITNALYKSLDGSGIEVRGHVVLGQGMDAYSIQDDIGRVSPITVLPGPRGGSVTVTETMVRRRPQGELTQIDGPEALGRFAEKIGQKNAIVLMDNQNRVMGVLAMAPQEMRKLRTGGRVRRLLEAFNATNVSAVAILSTNRAAAQNLSNFVRQGQHARLLDVWLAEVGPGVSLKEQGDPLLYETGPFFARGDKTKAPPMNAAKVEASARRIFDRSGLAASGVTLRVPATEAELPAAVRDEIRAQGADGEVDGFLWGNEVWVLPWRMRDEVDVERVILHEAPGHWGFRQLYGRGAVRRAQEIYLAVGGDAGIRGFAERHGVDLGGYFDTAETRYKDDPRGRAFLLVDELLAHVQANGPKSLPERIVRLLQEFVGAVRQWLRDRGFAELAKWNDADLFRELRLMRDAATSRGDATAGGKPVRFVRGEGGVALGRVQIKSAIGNIGTYSDLPDIRFARSGREPEGQASSWAPSNAVGEPSVFTFQGIGQAARETASKAEAEVREAMRTGRPPDPWIAATKGKGSAPSGALSPSKGGAPSSSKGGALSPSKGTSEGGRLRDWLTGALTDEKGGGVLAGLTLRQLADVGERHLPQLKLLVRGMQAFQTERNKMFEQATGRVKEWRQFGRAEAARIAEIMHESTIAQWDPSKADGGAPPFDAKEAKRRIRQINRMEAEMPGERGERWNQWRAERDQLQADMRLHAYRERHRERIEALWRELSPEARQFYQDVRDDYLRLSERMEQAIIARIEASELAEEVRKQAMLQVRQEFEQARLQGPYFPLQRHGRYYAVLTKPTGKTYQDKKTGELREEQERAFLLFESPRERRVALVEARAEGWEVAKQGVTATRTAALDAVSEGFVADSVARFRDKLGSYEGDKAAEVLYQAFLATMPYLSHRVHFIHRKKTAGYSEDALRAYAFNSAHLANQIARQEQLPLWEGAMRDAERHVQDVQASDPQGDATWSDSFLNEARARFEWLMNPKGSAWASMANALGFVWYLGLTPAAALVNLMQTPTIALPELGSHYGMAASSRALTRAMGQALAARRHPTRRNDYAFWNLTDEERVLMDWGHDAGVIDTTQVGMLMGMAETDSTQYHPHWTRAMEIIGALFQDAEVVNRQATLLAAYRLERARNPGGSMEAARERAADLVWSSHFDYSNANRARLMQGDMARLLLQFKNYAQHMTYYLTRNLWQATRGEAPEVRAEARKRLAGVIGMTAAMAGSAGLPFAVKWALMGTFGLAALLFGGGGEGDEPWDTETEWRSWLAQWGWLGKVADRGLVNATLGIDLSSRLGMDQLWLRDADRDLNGRDTWHHYVDQLLGPVVGIGASLFKGADLMADGHVERGVEAMVPKAVKDQLRAGRYAVEGVQTTKGDEILPRDQVGPWDVVMQSMGFTPDQIRAQWDTNAMKKDYEQYKIDRRSALIGAFALARVENDDEAQERAREAIRAYNEQRSGGEKAITGDDLRQSLRTRARYRAQSEGGIYIQPQYREGLERVRAP